jgi:hypothetical protein
LFWKTKSWTKRPYTQWRRQLDNWGANIHIFVFCIINFFWNRLSLWSVNTNIWIFAPPPQLSSWRRHCLYLAGTELDVRRLAGIQAIQPLQTLTWGPHSNQNMILIFKLCMHHVYSSLEVVNKTTCMFFYIFFKSDIDLQE